MYVKPKDTSTATFLRQGEELAKEEKKGCEVR